MSERSRRTSSLSRNLYQKPTPTSKPSRAGYLKRFTRLYSSGRTSATSPSRRLMARPLATSNSRHECSAYPKPPFLNKLRSSRCKSLPWLPDQRRLLNSKSTRMVTKQSPTRADRLNGRNRIVMHLRNLQPAHALFLCHRMPKKLETHLRQSESCGQHKLSLRSW